MLTKATAHFRPFIRLPSSSGASPDHFTANPSLLHHLPHNGAGNTLVVQGSNPTQTAGSSGNAGRHGYGGNAGAGGGYTGHARAFLSLPQTASVDPSSTLSNSDDNRSQDPSSNKSSLLLKHRLSKRTRIVGPSDGLGREVRREIEGRAGGSKVTVMELENGEEVERPERLALPSSGRSRRRSSIAFPSTITSAEASSSRPPIRSSTPSRQQRAGLIRSPSSVEIWQVGIPQPRARLGLRSLSTRSDIPRSSEAEDVEPLILATSTRATRVLGQPNRVLMDLAGRDLPGRSLGMVRRNSTAAVERASLDQPPVELLLQNQKTEVQRSSLLDAEPREVAIHDALVDARNAGDIQLVEQLVQHYRSPRSVSPFSDDKQPGDPALLERYPLSEEFSLRTYNACLGALVSTRKPGQSIADILEIYNEILERDLVPNNVTYGFVIRALALRSVEVSDAISSWEEQKSWGEWRALLVGPQTWNFELAKEKDQLFESYQAEGNLANAQKLFRAAIRVNTSSGFPLPVYGTLLDAMSRESRPDLKAIFQTFTMAQRWDVPGYISLYKHIFHALGNAKDLKQLHEAWNEFLKLSKSEKSEKLWSSVNPGPQKSDPTTAFNRIDGIRQEIWHNAITAFIAAGEPTKSFEILGQMMESVNNSSTTVSDTIKYDQAPPATHRTLGKMIVDLAKSGEIDLALEWNLKINSAEYLDKIPPHRLTLEHLCALTDLVLKANRLEDAKKLSEYLATLSFNTPASKTSVGRRLWRIYTSLVIKASEVEGEERKQILDEIQAFSKPNSIPLDLAILTKHLALLARLERWENLPASLDALSVRQSPSKDMQIRFCKILADLSETNVPFRTLLTLTQQISAFGVRIDSDLASTIVSKFTTADLELPNHLVFTVIETFASLPEAKIEEGEYDDALLSLVSILEKTHKADNFIVQIKDHQSLQTVIKSIVHRFGVERSKHLLTPIFGEEQAEAYTKVTPSLEELLSSSSSNGSPESSEFNPSSPPSSATSAPSTGKPEYHLRLDKSLSSSIERFTNRNPTITALEAYALVKQGLTKNIVPFPNTLCLLIDHLSRQGDEKKVLELYSLCQVILNQVIRPENQSSNWHQIEDIMLIANCHLGHLEQAGMHRSRIIENGMSPSADAYATMIASSKDTTDDALVARELFDESQLMGVKPHLYLYNTIISKLSKARKAETALELFSHMKTQGIRPSSVTYGAVINACCRVGDAQSAETLFQEMASQPNFRARVPPFNTLMQFYLQTQPNRERVLHYYNLLQGAGVPPSAHTYKLLLDTYATLAPIDLEAMENVFSQIQQDRNVHVQGTHWASLINAYGIHGGNLEKSKEIFESIPTRGKQEAVVWESMLNVISQRGTLEDLESTRSKMLKTNVQPTAYVYNALINGYSRSGKIEKSREVFNSMGDSISGVAAPNNHPNLLTSSGNLKPNTITEKPTNIIYREPSTYEIMIKSEIKYGNKDQAKKVLDKMEERGYPLAVFLRGKAAFEENPIL